MWFELPDPLTCGYFSIVNAVVLHDAICRSGGTVDTESWQLVMRSSILVLFKGQLYVYCNTLADLK